MPHRKKKLLIIEDERDLVDTLALRLRAAGRFEVGIAYDGEAGLAMCAGFMPEVILLDVSLPKMGGWEVCQALRTDPRFRGIPLVVATAWLVEDTKKQAARWGVARLLSKPFEERELVGILSALAPEVLCEPAQRRGLKS